MDPARYSAGRRSGAGERRHLRAYARARRGRRQQRGVPVRRADSRHPALHGLSALYPAGQSLHSPADRVRRLPDEPSVSRGGGAGRRCGLCARLPSHGTAHAQHRGCARLRLRVELLVRGAHHRGPYAERGLHRPGCGGAAALVCPAASAAALRRSLVRAARLRTRVRLEPGASPHGLAARPSLRALHYSYPHRPAPFARNGNFSPRRHGGHGENNKALLVFSPCPPCLRGENPAGALSPSPGSSSFYRSHFTLTSRSGAVSSWLPATRP